MNMENFLRSGYKGNLLALIAGALLTLSFAPFYIYPLAIISPAVLFALWLRLNKKQAFWRGWIYGLGFFGTGVSWVFISINEYSDATVAMATILTMLFVAVLAVFPGFTGYLAKRFFKRRTENQIIFAMPAIWLLLEWARSWIFTGFPWLLLGDSQLFSPLKGYAPVFGVYGITLAVAVSSGLLLNSAINFRKDNKKRAVINLLIMGLIWSTGAGLSAIKWTKPSGDPIKVSLIQGNIDQGNKWDQSKLMPTLDLYKNLTEKHLDSKIIIWPEDAVPLPLQYAEGFIEDVADKAKANNSTVITGIPVKNGEENTYFNAVVAVGSNYSYYLKNRLVPFGEYTPLQKYLKGFMQQFNLPMANMVPGGIKNQKPLLIGDLKIATFICYEIAYPELARFKGDDTGILLTVSNDAWFGKSIALAQHFAMAQMRSLELGRPSIFVSNTGITAIAKPNGALQSSISPHKVNVLTDTIQPMTGTTYWQKHGMDPILLMMLVFYL